MRTSMAGWNKTSRSERAQELEFPVNEAVLLEARQVAKKPLERR